ncbi:hypothetical protein Aperf_G00000127425 [Anoplocephala perfoliata]
MLDQDDPFTEIALRRDGVNLRFKAASWCGLNKTLELNPSIGILMNEAQIELRNYLLQHSMELCTSEEEFHRHFESAYSILPRLGTICSFGRMQLAMTHESLFQCLLSRKNDYCFAFVKISSSVTSKKVLIATPDFAVSRADFATAVYGLVFPFWPMSSTTLIIPHPKFQSDLILTDPYNREYSLASYLAYLGDESFMTPKMVESLSVMKSVRITITNINDIVCFPNGVPLTDVKPRFLPCSLSKDLIRQSKFCLIVLDKWDSLTASAVRSIHAQLWTCLMFHSIPVIPTPFEAEIAEIYLPFFHLLRSLWTGAIVFQPFEDAIKFLANLEKMTPAERTQRLDKGSKLFNRHLRTVGKQVETAVAQLNKALSLPQPAAPVVRTNFISEIPETSIRIYELNAIYNNTKSIVSDISGGIGSTCSTFLQTDFEGPLWTFNSTPWTPCNSSDLGYSKKFTAIILTYDRIQMLLKNIAIFNVFEHLVESIIIVWNHQVLKPESFQWPKLRVPIHIIRTKVNSLQNRFLPFDLIRTDAVLTVDDEVIPEPKALENGFEVWSEYQDRIIGFVARGHEWLKSEGKFRYVAKSLGSYSLILTGASFFHKYYLYAYTFELPHEIYSTVGELMNCEDIAMNMLSQQISERDPHRVYAATRFACPSCKSGLSTKKSHYTMRSVCITNFINFFGYDPLKFGSFMRKYR